MSKVITSGKSLVITSALNFSDLKTIEKFDPASLTALDSEKRPVFCVGTCTGNGSINNNGAFFVPGVGDSAQITMVVNDWGGSPKEYVTENLCGCLSKLNDLEATLPAVLEKVGKQKAAIEESVESL